MWKKKTAGRVTSPGRFVLMTDKVSVLLYGIYNIFKSFDKCAQFLVSFVSKYFKTADRR